MIRMIPIVLHEVLTTGLSNSPYIQTVVEQIGEWIGWKKRNAQTPGWTSVTKPWTCSP